jgi:hypothetical protein
MPSQDSRGFGTCRNRERRRFPAWGQPKDGVVWSEMVSDEGRRLFRTELGGASLERRIDCCADLLKQFSRIFLELLDHINRANIIIRITRPMLPMRPR